MPGFKGDVKMINIKPFIKEFLCVHEYKWKTRECGFQSFRVGECCKCGKVKVK